MVHRNALLLYALASVATLMLVIAKLWLNPFVVLVVVSLAVGIAVGMPLTRS